MSENLPSRSAIKAAQNDKELARIALQIAKASTLNVTKAAAALLALQLAPWPIADPVTLEKWRHSLRLPMSLEAAREASRGIAGIGFIQGAWWFLDQAMRRANLADFVAKEEGEKIKAMMTELKETWKFEETDRFRNLTSETSALPDACNDCTAMTVKALKAELPPTLTCCPRLSRLIRIMNILNSPDTDCLGLMNACAELLALLGPMSRLPVIRDYLICQVVPRAHLPHLALLSQLRHLQRKLDHCTESWKKCNLLLERVDVVKFPFDPTAVYMQRDSLGRLWAICGESIDLVCSDANLIDQLVNQFNSCLAMNKADVKASKEGRDVKEFWDERKIVDREMGEIIDKFSEAVLGDFKFPAGEIRIALSADLLSFPVESTRQFQGRGATRIVPITAKEIIGTGSAAVLNPSGDLPGTEQAMRGVLPADCCIHSGKPALAESALIDILGRAKFFVYAGHCGGEKLWNGTAIQRLPRISADVFLLGCRSAQPYSSSIAPFCTPFHYLVGGSSSVVGILWDVLGRDCDRASSALISAYLNGCDFSISVSRAREACKLKNLTASAFVVYSPIIEL